VLQHLANFAPPFESAPMNIFNSLLQANREPVREFFLKLTMESSEGRPTYLPRGRGSKNEIIDRDNALGAIFMNLQGRCLDRLTKQSRVAMAKIETEDFLNLCNNKWKSYKRRSDSEAWKTMDNFVASSKVSGLIRAPVLKVFEFFKQYERSLNLWPNMVRSKVVKVYDESHVDMSVQVNSGFPFGGIREFNFSRYDRLDHVSEDCQRAIIVAFPLEKPENPEENVKRSRFRTSGLVVESIKDNRGICWFTLIVSLDKKDVPSYIEALQYSVLETVRKECEG